MKTLVSGKKLSSTIVSGLLFSLFAFTACDSSNALLEADSGAAGNLTPTVANLSDQLDLTQRQAGELDELIARRGEREPGTLWYVAAELQASLSADQKATLLRSISEDGGPLRFQRGMARQGAAFQSRMQRSGEGMEDVIGDLTDEQEAQLKALHEKHGEEVKALMERRRDGSLRDEEMRSSMQAVRESMRSELEEILTEEQLAALDAAREERAENMRRRSDGETDRAGFRGMRGDGPGPRFDGEAREASSIARIEALNLTGEQQAQMEAAAAAQKELADALREELKASEVDREAMGEKMKALRDEGKAAMAEILTRDQLEIIEIHRALSFMMAKNRTGVASDGRRTRRFDRLRN